MTEDHEKDLANIKAKFLEEVDDQYRKGNSEHGGDLWSHSTLWKIRNAKAEAVDTYVYLNSLEVDELNRLRRIDEQQRKASQPDESQQ
jgi:hypothetical protein